MSHFLTGVIIDKRIPKEDRNYTLNLLLGAYDENEEVAPYEMVKDGKKEMCTYNPDSKWDWWVIGGRWDGIISKSGKQRESKDGGFNFGDEHHDMEKNICLVKELPAKSLPFAIVTPDGEWHEKGEMGWWGLTNNEKEDNTWEKELHKILKKYADDYIIGVDCHI
jgi:hypothetical protein